MRSLTRTMVALSCVTLLAVIAMASGAPPDKPFYDVNEAPKLFEQFIKDFDRNYKDEADRAAHYEAFVKSLETINKLNKNSDSATYGINNFADFTPEEKKQRFGHGILRN